MTGDEHEISAKIRTMAAERRVDVRIAYDGMKHHAVMRLRMDSPLSMSNVQAAGCSRRPVGDAFNEVYAHRASHSEAATGLSNTAAACNCRRQDCLRHVIAREV